MGTTPDAPHDPARPPAGVLGDLAAARASFGESGLRESGAVPAPRTETVPLHALGIIGGVVVYTVGAFIAIGSTIGVLVALAGGVLAVASTRGAHRRGRVGWLGGLGLACALGWMLLVGGLAAGSRSYDARYIFDDDSALWEAVSWVGYLMVLLGALMLPVSIVGLVVVALGRGIRAATRSG